MSLWSARIHDEREQVSLIEALSDRGVGVCREAAGEAFAEACAGSDRLFVSIYFKKLYQISFKSFAASLVMGSWKIQVSLNR